MLLGTYWRWISILLLGVALNYVVNKVFDLRYGARSSFDPQEVFMAILFSFIILEGSRWIRERLHASTFQITRIPVSLFTYPVIFIYITFIILGVGNLVNILFYGGANQSDENFIVLLLTLFFTFPVLALDYLWKYKAQLDEVNELLFNKQEELRQFRKHNQSKVVIEASHGMNKVLVTPDQILMIYREHTIVYIVNRDYKKLVCNLSLDALETLLPSNGFCRANRQFILTPDVIQSIKSGSYGKIELQLIAENNIPAAATVSRPSASGFRRWLNDSTSALVK
ncbi:MAG TPA: LytTR family DNA-binding domain-containing protein [Cyclobacteriaceae bacterium]|nr:LytTR family DNA-binding domain-containing protein [Cyclobacteriaceae bacterium]